MLAGGFFTASTTWGAHVCHETNHIYLKSTVKCCMYTSVIYTITVYTVSTSNQYNEHIHQPQNFLVTVDHFNLHLFANISVPHPISWQVYLSLFSRVLYKWNHVVLLYHATEFENTPPKRYVPILILSYLWSLFGNEVIFMELRWAPTEWEKVRSVSCTIVSNSLQSHGLQPARILCPWDSPGKNSGVGCHALLQGIFLTQGSNPGLLHWQADSLPS